MMNECRYVRDDLLIYEQIKISGNSFLVFVRIAAAEQTWYVVTIDDS